MMYNILIVEDDLPLSNGIVLALKSEGFSFTQCNTISAARKALPQTQYALIILDVNLPDGNGLDLLKEIRAASAVPVIMLTANDLETDIVTGLELGADDYITKPFSLMVLRARVNTQLRKQATTTATSASGAVFELPPYRFDFDKMEFTHGGRAIELSKTEQRLLRLLVENRGSTVTRDSLVDKIWTDGAEYVDENALSVTVKRLRDKLEDTARKPQFIRTVYGIGYTWAVKQ